MTDSTAHNDRIPTDPYVILILLLTITWTATQLTTEQAAALTSTGVIAELVLSALRLPRGGR